MSAVRRSLLYSFANNHLGMLLQLASSMVIARLLTPTEIGIFAVAAVFAALASAFRDFGIAEYLIQAKELTTEKIRAAFGLNILVSWSIAVLLLSASSPVATFYEQAGIAQVMRVQALNFFLIPFGAITMAYHRRKLNYQPLFIAGLWANIVGILVAVGGALSNLSYMSLAWSSFANVVVFLIVALIYRPVELPQWPSFRGMAEVFHFGWRAVTIYLLGQLGKSAPDAVIGRVIDMPSVAFFSRADGLVEIFRRAILNTVGHVCLPYFSAAVRAGEPIASAYVRSSALMLGIGWPFLLCTAIAAESIIRLFYGSQWGASVPLAHIICVAGIIRLPYSLASEAIIAAGQIGQSSRLQWLSQLTLLACLGLIFPFGLMGAAYGVLLSAVLSAIFSQHFLRRIIGLRFRQISVIFHRTTILAAGSAMPTAFLALMSDQNAGYYWFVPLAVLLSATSWFLILKNTSHPLYAEIKDLFDKLAKKLG